MEDLQAIKEYGFGGKGLCRLYSPPKTENPAVQDSFFLPMDDSSLCQKTFQLAQGIIHDQFVRQLRRPGKLQRTG